MNSWTHVLAVVVGAARPDGDAGVHFGSLLGFNAHLSVAQRLGLVQAAPEPVADDAPEVLLTDIGREFVEQFAVVLLALVRDKILEPFPEEPDDYGRSDLSRTNIDPAYLIGRRIAVTAPRFSSAQQHDPGLQAHPDVMFALRLADEPAPDSTPRLRE